MRRRAFLRPNFHISARPSPTPLPLLTQGRLNTNASSPSPATSQSTPSSIDSILIANRGEIALRINRTASSHGIRTTTLYTDPDAQSQHAHCSPYSFNLGPTSAYLDQDKIISIAQQQGCQAIHPGYGFLSENPTFALKCAEAGIKFLGPPASAITSMGDKARSKEIMEAAGVPCVPGYHGSNQDPTHLESEADKIGYPVLIKAVRGGGGKGMRIVPSQSEFQDLLRSAQSESLNSFGNADVLVEKYITTPRHIEVQIFADQHSNCLALGERDCSIQRRHQKILEESPAPLLPESIRQDIWAKARAAALAVSYEGAGTVEFIFDNDSGDFYFMEMNTRLQVEHPVTEMVTGLDLVHWQILVAEGHPLPLTQSQVSERIASRGHAIEARIYAENPARNFTPDSGVLSHVHLPTLNETVRIDSGFIAHDVVSSHYDPMIAKLIVRGVDRADAVRKMSAALNEYEIAGPVTNIEFLKRICLSSDFRKGEVETGYIGKHREELFSEEEVSTEVLVEAGLGCFFDSTLHQTQQSRRQHGLTQKWPATGPSWLTTSTDFQPRTFTFQRADAEVSPGSGAKQETFSVDIQQLSPGTFQATRKINETETASWKVTSTYDASTRTLETYFPHARHTSRVILPPPQTTAESQPQPIHLFTPTTSIRLLPTPPPFLSLALGKSDVPSNSLLSPMPAKILRVAVQAGDVVGKDQILLVIESMKMETVVRSPGEGLRVKRVVHGEGEVVGSGVVLVEFEEEES